MGGTDGNGADGLDGPPVPPQPSQHPAATARHPPQRHRVLLRSAVRLQRAAADAQPTHVTRVRRAHSAVRQLDPLAVRRGAGAGGGEQGDDVASHSAACQTPVSVRRRIAFSTASHALPTGSKCACIHAPFHTGHASVHGSPSQRPTPPPRLTPTGAERDRFRRPQTRPPTAPPAHHLIPSSVTSSHSHCIKSLDPASHCTAPLLFSLRPGLRDPGGGQPLDEPPGNCSGQSQHGTV